MCVSQTFLLAHTCCLRKITTDPHIRFQVIIRCPDDRHRKLKVYMSELIIDSYDCISVAQVTMLCMILPKLI